MFKICSAIRNAVSGIQCVYTAAQLLC